MNIIIQDCKGIVSCRPDTTRDREGRNLFAPEFVTGYSYAPVLFARLCKVGKRVEARFATRYYDAVNYGLLLYPETPDGLSVIMDRTSFLPFPMYDKAVLESEANVFEIHYNEETLFSTTTVGGTKLLEKAILSTSKFMLLRMGDLIAVELAPVSPLPSDTSFQARAPQENMGPKHRLTATFCGEKLFDFCVK